MYILKKRRGFFALGGRILCESFMATRQVAGGKFPGACLAVAQENNLCLSLIVTHPGTLMLQDAKPTLSGYPRGLWEWALPLVSARNHQGDCRKGWRVKP